VYFRRFVDVPRKDFLHPMQSVIGVVERRETIERDGTNLEVELVVSSAVSVQA
jgi:hypothetical protein